MCSGLKVTFPLWWIVMQLSVSMCVIGSLICNPERQTICHIDDPIFTVTHSVCCPYYWYAAHFNNNILDTPCIVRMIFYYKNHIYHFKGHYGIAGMTSFEH